MGKGGLNGYTEQNPPALAETKKNSGGEQGLGHDSERQNMDEENLPPDMGQRRSASVIPARARFKSHKPGVHLRHLEAALWASYTHA